MKFSRRSALELALALWARAEDQAHQHSSNQASSTTYKLRFLTPSESATLNRFAAIMIPPSGRSGGAAAAHVEAYVDHILTSAAPSLQRLWRSGLETWSKASNADQLLSRLVLNEFSPRSKQDQFFILFKSAVTTAFYTSEEGISRELGYQGMGFIRDFPGYQGEAFSTPPDYKPLLRTRS